MLEESAKQLFATHCKAEHVRKAQQTGEIETLLNELVHAGFVDALVPEADGGAGLSLIDLAPVLFQAGAHAAPLPLGDTIVARTEPAVPSGSGAVAIAPGPLETTAKGRMLSNVPFGRVASYVIARSPADWHLLPLEEATVLASPSSGILGADLLWPHDAPNGLTVERQDWFRIGALMRAVEMAGAMGRLLEMTVAYAMEREQFGRAIAKQQAIQQQIGEMAEHCYAARISAELGLAGFTDPSASAIAKSRVSEAAVRVGAIAHAVHGAIGITEEHDLQLYTRRLVEARIAYGGESYWNRELGQALLNTTDSSMEFVLSVSARKKMPIDL